MKHIIFVLVALLLLVQVLTFTIESVSCSYFFKEREQAISYTCGCACLENPTYTQAMFHQCKNCNNNDTFGWNSNEMYEQYLRIEERKVTYIGTTLYDTGKSLTSKNPITNKSHFILHIHSNTNNFLSMGVLTENIKQLALSGYAYIDGMKEVLTYTISQFQYRDSKDNTGMIANDGKWLYDADFYVAKGQELMMEIDPQKLEVVFTNYKKTITIQLADSFKNKSLYMYIQMQKQGQIIEMM